MTELGVAILAAVGGGLVGWGLRGMADLWLRRGPFVGRPHRAMTTGAIQRAWTQVSLQESRGPGGVDVDLAP